MSWFEQFLAAGVVVPLVAFAVLAFFGARIGKPKAGWVAVGAIFISFLLSACVTYGWWSLSPAERAGFTAVAASENQFHWGELGHVSIDVGIKLDSLTVIMYFMVTLIATCIFVFSVGYMAGHSDEVDHQSKFHRFFTYLCLFAFSMLGLVVSSSLLFLFIFWELVGLCSYFLIGFYFDKKYASNAAIKAFVTNRVGDFGFLIGLMLVFFYLQTLDLDEAARRFADQHANGTDIFAAGTFSLGIFSASIATWMGIGLFCGAMGKSAQFPLHVWLPDAMAGPTPVSALIHAATMVAAGVYLVARVFRLLTPEAQFFIAVIGCITLTLMALIAIVQTDIKKVLAYSTLSQLGYMIFAMGIGAWIAALFHLMTHAFFKAMMFLGSGQVIEGTHHEQDIRKFGGLIKKMPVTGITFLIGVLAIAGFGIPKTSLGIGGFFSKDEILAVAYHRAYHWNESKAPEHADARTDGSLRLIADERTTPHPTPETGHKETHGAHAGHGPFVSPKSAILGQMPGLPKWMFWLPIIIAYVTPFYMMRCWYLTFWGKPRDRHVYDHAHESPLMYLPLVVLAIGTFLCGWFLFRPMLAEAAEAATNAPAIVAIDGVAEEPAEAHGEWMNVHVAHGALTLYVGISWLIGMGLAALIYWRGLDVATRIVRLPIVRQVHMALVDKLYFDHVYNAVIVKGGVGLAYVCRFFDTYVVDLIYNLAAGVTERLAAFTGNVLDAHGVDGIVNGIADASQDFAAAVRRPQTGRIRNYVLFATASATVILLLVFYLARPHQTVARGQPMPEASVLATP